MMEEASVIMAALSTLPQSQLSDLTHSILSETHRQSHRLSTLLSSRVLFSLALHHLNSLSLPRKTLLIARHLLSALHRLTRHFQPHVAPPHHSYTSMKQRDVDAVLLLLLLCELRHRKPEALQTSTSTWLQVLSSYCTDAVLGLSGIGVYNGAVLIPYIEMVTRCRRFVGVMGCPGKAAGEVAASPAAVVALPSTEVAEGGVECAVCREEMGEGRDVCMLPCEHLFHWMCILPWLRKKNTCPCCRFQLPTDDVFGEIERLWAVLVKLGDKSMDG